MHMPGHKGRVVPEEFSAAALLDVTELSETGNLYALSTPIDDALALSAQAYGAKEAFFLTCGASQGVKAMLKLAAGSGKKTVVLEQTSHISAYLGCAALGLKILLLPQRFDSESGLSFPPDDKIIEDFIVSLGDTSDIAAFLLTSPNYFGITASLERLGSIIKKTGAYLLVDEAHGSHFAFSDKMPLNAARAGADMCVCSAHKTLPSLTQSAFLLSTSNEFSQRELAEASLFFGSTSPSYLLMSSLDWARAYMEERGEELLGRLCVQCEKVRNKLRENGIICLEKELTAPMNCGFDPARLTVLFPCSADLIGKKLEKSGIYPEMCFGRCLVLLPPLDMTDAEADELVCAIVNAANEIYILQKPLNYEKISLKSLLVFAQTSELFPAAALLGKTERLAAECCVGRVCAQAVYSCPPGYPEIFPSQRITQAHIDSLAGRVETLLVSTEEI